MEVCFGMNVSNLAEKDLHPFLVTFAHQQFGCYTKTIDEKKSNRKEAGENEWIHPDVVGFKLNRNDFSSQLQSFYRQMNQDTAYLYSFELKLELKLKDLKKYYFQAVSNSSWANEGYLVTASLDTTNRGLMGELNRLVQAFGIGVILLDFNHYERSCILFEAKKRLDLDFFTINKLIESKNDDFVDFIGCIESCLNSKDSKDELAIINSRMDEIKSLDDLTQSLDDLTQKSLSHSCQVNTKNFSNNKVKLLVNTNSNIEWHLLDEIQSFTHSKVSDIKIGNQEISVSTFREVLTEIAKYCYVKNPLLFQSYCFNIENENIRLFFRNSQENWLNNSDYFYMVTSNTYLNVHGSSDELMKHTKKICQLFDIPLSEVWIKFAPNKSIPKK